MDLYRIFPYAGEKLTNVHIHQILSSRFNAFLTAMLPIKTGLEPPSPRNSDDGLLMSARSSASVSDTTFPFPSFTTRTSPNNALRRGSCRCVGDAWWSPPLTSLPSVRLLGEDNGPDKGNLRGPECEGGICRLLGARDVWSIALKSKRCS